MAVAVMLALAFTAFSLAQRRQALEAYSRSLGVSAQKALEDQDGATALAFALAATNAGVPAPVEVQRVLLNAAYAPGAAWRGDANALFAGGGRVTAVALHPDGQRALIGLETGPIVVWDIATRKETVRLQGHEAQVNDIVFSRDGTAVLSGGADQQVIVWDFLKGAARQRFSGHSGIVRAVDLSPDGATVVSGGFAGTEMLAPGELILWDLASGRELRRLNGHRSGIVAARFTADGERVIASSGDAEIFVDSLPIADTRPGITATDMLVWDVRTGEIRQRFEGMEDDAFALAIASDRTSVLTASFYQNRAEMWDLESGKLLQQLEGHREGVHAVSMSADGRRALTASCDDSMMLWDLTTGKRLAVLNGQASDVMAVTMSADGRTALSAGRDGSLMLWDSLTRSSYAGSTGTETRCGIRRSAPMAASPFPHRVRPPQRCGRRIPAFASGT